MTGIQNKILAVQKALNVRKTGYDDRNEYAYFKAEDITRDVKLAMDEVGVIHRTSIKVLSDTSHVDKNGRDRSRLTAEATVVFVDPEDGSEFPTDVIATGSDIGGDKAPRKLMVQLFKVAAIDVFKITEGIDEVDSDNDPEAEPDVEKKTATVPAAADKAKGTKELDQEVRAFIAAEDNALTGADVKEIGERLAIKHGVEPKSTVYRKNVNVMAELVVELGNLAKEQQDAAAKGGEVE